MRAIACVGFMTLQKLDFCFQSLNNEDTVKLELIKIKNREFSVLQENWYHIRLSVSELREKKCGENAVGSAAAA
jgi:hypothetical protein